jgi:hypothetical protein
LCPVNETKVTSATCKLFTDYMERKTRHLRESKLLDSHLPTQLGPKETEIDVHQIRRLYVGGCSDCDILLCDAV